jgi:hypothetical protein
MIPSLKSVDPIEFTVFVDNYTGMLLTEQTCAVIQLDLQSEPV